MSYQSLPPLCFLFLPFDFCLLPFAFSLSPFPRFSDSPLPSVFLSLSLSLSFSFLLVSCQAQTPQTGHRVIAEAVRELLDKAYAGADYPTYRDELHKLEVVIAKEQNNTPVLLQSKTEEMLGYLRMASEILRWQMEQKTSISSSANDPLVQRWIRQYAFLGAAVGAHTPDVFDVQTAVTLLWDKTNAVLPEFQVKSRPL